MPWHTDNSNLSLFTCATRATVSNDIHSSFVENFVRIFRVWAPACICFKAGTPIEFKASTVTVMNSEASMTRRVEHVVPCVFGCGRTKLQMNRVNPLHMHSNRPFTNSNTMMDNVISGRPVWNSCKGDPSFFSCGPNPNREICFDALQTLPHLFHFFFLVHDRASDTG